MAQKTSPKKSPPNTSAFAIARPWWPLLALGAPFSARFWKAQCLETQCVTKSPCVKRRSKKKEGGGSSHGGGGQGGKQGILQHIAKSRLSLGRHRARAPTEGKSVLWVWRAAFVSL
jgi:hypothetical protein